MSHNLLVRFDRAKLRLLDFVFWYLHVFIQLVAVDIRYEGLYVFGCARENYFIAATRVD